MIILPAIDIYGGRCVRLQKGDFGTARRVADDPLEAMRMFELAGAKWLHMVDLDGAKTGERVNRDLILSMVRGSALRVELGGGIRGMDAVEDYLHHGVSRVILGSAALQNPDFVRQAVARFGERVAVGIDAREGQVAAQGWLEQTDVEAADFARQMEEIGVQTLIVTDIAKDGMLAGPSYELLETVTGGCACRVIASGGVSTIEDVRRLKGMGLYGAICGKAIYTGGLELRQAILEGGEQDAG